jgi:hypothetical protein
VGDAGAFIDPFYSPGMDWIAFTSSCAVNLIMQSRKGEDMAMLVNDHNHRFSRSYQRWFEAIYQNKYEYMCEYDLMRLGFLLDLGFYYGGVASQPFKRGVKALLEPVFSTGPSIPFYWLIKTYNRRLAKIARRRRLKGELGRRNGCKSSLIPGFSFARSSIFSVLKNLGKWGALEMREGWKTWFREVEFKSVQNETADADEEKITQAMAKPDRETSPTRSALDCVTAGKEG